MAPLALALLPHCSLLLDRIAQLYQIDIQVQTRQDQTRSDQQTRQPVRETGQAYHPASRAHAPTHHRMQLARHEP
jgi:hypothetical protein